jgi:hypothetical protein
MLYFGIITQRFTLWRKVIASKSYDFGRKGAVFATYRYRSINILLLAISAPKTYFSDSLAKAITYIVVFF